MRTKAETGSASFIRFGALSPQLKEQLAHFRLDRAIVRSFQKDADALTRLYMCDLLAESEVRKARQRLVANVRRAINAAAKARLAEARS